MEYDKRNRFLKHDSAAMGAIFMCNNLTKKECFRRKLFGLPSVHSDFVKQVKTGMILFLFEPDEKQLHGIFQATSDGAMNIVPSAFSISKKSFPAQVRFERLCACRPLFENEFGDAIKENYFTASKFSFALSGQQVCRLIWLFSSRSYLPYDQLPGGLQSEFSKIFENSRSRVTGNENLPKVNAAGYTVDNNNQPTRNSFLLQRKRNHLASDKDHYHNDITLQNHMVRGHREPYPAVSHSAKLKQRNLTSSKYCNDLSREAIPVIPSGHSNSSRSLYKQPSVASGTDAIERKLKLTSYSGSSLDASTPDLRNQSYVVTSHLGTKDILLSNQSKPFQLTSRHPEDHVDIHDFRQNAFQDSYDLSNNKFLHSSPERFQAMPSTSLYLRNERSNCQPIQHKDDSWNIQDRPSRSDHIPILESEALVNRGYVRVLDDDLAYAKEAFDLPSRKDKSSLALQYDYSSGFTTDTNKLHRPEDHVDFHDFRQNAFEDSYDLPNNNFLHSSPERLQARATTSLCLGNARSYCQPIQHKDDSWNIQDRPSASEYIPILEGEALVNRGYVRVLDDDLAYAKEAFDLPSRKEKSSLALQYDYSSGFTTDTNKLHRPEDHVDFHDFRQNAFQDSYDLPNNKILHSSPERLQAVASTSLCLRNARSYCQPIHHKDDSWNIQDRPSSSDYIPILEGEGLVNRGYVPVFEDDPAYAKEAFDIPSRKEKSPLALHYDYISGFTTDTNRKGSRDFPYNDKNSVPDLNTFPKSNTFQKKCNVFLRLSRTPKKLKYPSLDHMVEAFYHQRSQRPKVCRKLEKLEESFETDAPLDSIGELGSFDLEPQIKQFDDSKGLSIPNFKRRSVAKRRSNPASDSTGCADNCQRRKLIRPSFSEEDNSSQVEDHSVSCTVSNPGIKVSVDSTIDDRISKTPANLQDDKDVPKH